MKYSIIIPTFNKLEFLKPCVESIIQTTDLSDSEVIIVSNGCVDGTIDFVNGLPKPFKSIVISEALGYPTAVNLGLQTAVGDFIILLNNDTIIYGEPKANRWLNTLMAPFEQNPGCGVTGPLKQWNSDVSMEFIIFFCAMISRKCFESVGLLDAIFSPGSSEDIDFCIKAQLKGFRIFQVPVGEELGSDGAYRTGSFPIYHKAEGTVHDILNWDAIFERNKQIIKARYGRSLQNDW